MMMTHHIGSQQCLGLGRETTFPQTLISKFHQFVRHGVRTDLNPFFRIGRPLDVSSFDIVNPTRTQEFHMI